MKNKILLPAFLLMVLAQLYVPVRLVMQSENILETGKAFKFRTGPVYPLYPVNGNMILLNYEGTTVPVENAKDWNQNEPVYVALAIDSAGFAVIDHVSKAAPENNVDYVKAYIDYVIDDSTSSVVVRYPFDRFYLENKMDHTPGPEPSSPDSAALTYAIVIIKNGEAIVEDVLVNEKSIKDIRDGRQ